MNHRRIALWVFFLALVLLPEDRQRVVAEDAEAIARARARAAESQADEAMGALPKGVVS